MSGQTGTATVLVVDDNPATLYSTSRVLRATGCRVIEATSGEEALAKIDKTIDLVVLDVNLPDINGFEVCRQIRELESARRIPVIHLSASFVNDDAKVHGLESGADGYLTHPVEPPVLIATVNAFLRTRQIEIEREQLLISERAARAEAERANRLKDDFLATLSHELRTPLHAIIGWAQLLQMQTLDPAEAREGLDAIERNAKAQAQMIADLLDVSRITSGKLRLDAQPVDAAAMVEAALSAILPAAAAKGIRVHKLIDPEVGPVSGDPARLQQIVWNLVQNAVKFTPRDGRVQISLSRINSHVEVRVKDSGQGISPELLTRIFDRFQQGDASTTRSHGGLGLGLAIAKQLVELHGGAIRAESEGEGKGATFIVTLPAAGPPRRTPFVPPPSADKDRESQSLSRVNLKGVQVLLVDDDADARRLLKRIVEELGAEATDVDNVPSAIATIEQHCPQILVSDLGMPLVDGFQLIQQLRAKGYSSEKLPAIALTAFARPEDRRRALLAGYQVHLPKPIDPHELTTAIATLAGR